jgi:hypothetical protein
MDSTRPGGISRFFFAIQAHQLLNVSSLICIRHESHDAHNKLGFYWGFHVKSSITSMFTTGLLPHSQTPGAILELQTHTELRSMLKI